MMAFRFPTMCEIAGAIATFIVGCRREKPGARPSRSTTATRRGRFFLLGLAACRRVFSPRRRRLFRLSSWRAGPIAACGAQKSCPAAAARVCARTVARSGVRPLSEDVGWFGGGAWRAGGQKQPSEAALY
ncbi:hypothetical protein TcCL_NonESM12434 [Trypanosoma cruzi]|nr:hypothetical protein TcCL_NonESM12434 [Trypanosoma cruzi]